MRELAAQLYALVISTMTGSDLQTSVHNLVKVTKDNHVRHCLPASLLSVVFLLLLFFFLLNLKRLCVYPTQSPETQHGAILALGYMVGRYTSKKKCVDASDSTQGKGKPKKNPSEEHADLLPMATKTVGMELCFARISIQWKTAFL